MKKRIPLGWEDLSPREDLPRGSAGGAAAQRCRTPAGVGGGEGQKNQPQFFLAGWQRMTVQYTLELGWCRIESYEMLPDRF